mmetsp:Transcript_21263/g.57228  ORF Transcript_21263/g.57228 Transcript_21263/m.57228 type:complete len:133 (-) Transcript_21263:49-447(-)
MLARAQQRIAPGVPAGRAAALERATHRDAHHERPHHHRQVSIHRGDNGAIAIAFALRYCRKVHLFGYGHNCSNASLSKGKYYSPHTGRNAYMRQHSLFHDPDMEWQWRTALDRSGAVIDMECGWRPICPPWC